MNGKPFIVVVIFLLFIALFAQGVMSNVNLTGHEPSRAGGAPVTGSSPALLSGGTCRATYTVRSGDTLFRIAQACGMTVADLLARNPDITNPNLIRPGQTLTIGSAAVQAEPAQSQPTAQPQVEVQPTTATQPQTAVQSQPTQPKAKPTAVNAQKPSGGQDAVQNALNHYSGSGGAQNASPVTAGAPAAAVPPTAVAAEVAAADPAAVKATTDAAHLAEAFALAADPADQPTPTPLPAQPAAAPTATPRPVTNTIVPAVKTVSARPSPTQTRPTLTAAALPANILRLPPGSPVTLVGTGFPASTPLLITLGPPGFPPQLSQQTVTDARGAAHVILTIPAAARSGERWVATFRTANPPLEVISAPFLIQ